MRAVGLFTQGGPEVLQVVEVAEVHRRPRRHHAMSQFDHFDVCDPELLQRDSASQARFARRYFLFRCRNLTGQNSAVATTQLAMAIFSISVPGKA